MLLLIIPLHSEYHEGRMSGHLDIWGQYQRKPEENKCSLENNE